MPDDLDELRASLGALPDQQLVDMVHDQPDQYRSEAFQIARDELRRRGIDPSQVGPDAVRTTPEARPFFLWVRSRPTVVARVGYLVFAAGTLACIWFARKPDPAGDNPALVLLLAWVIAGIVHFLVRAYWRACVISAIASGLGYVALVMALFPQGFENEMFAAGILEVGLFGFVVSMVVGALVALHRRLRKGQP